MLDGRATALVAVVAAVLALPAYAHEQGTHAGFVSVVSTIEPPVPGLVVTVIGGHERVSLTNLTRKRVVIFDARGERLVDVTPSATEIWREPRVGATAEPPDRDGLVRNWRIAGSADGQRFVIVGFLGYRTPADDREHDSGSRRTTWIIVAAAAGALVFCAALAVPLLRRER